jgi:acetoacetyl-CoA synthetase
MPIYFWNDPDFIKYKESYFEEYNIHWRHGDWLIIDEEGQLKITGRSDATLNRHGVRIGTAEIYNILDDITQISDSLIINVELKDGSNFMPLFIKMSPEVTLDDALAQIINQNLKSKGSPRHVPDKIIPVDDIPYTVSGKKMEAPIKKLFMGIDTTKAINMDVMRNPSCIPQFIALAKDFLFQN